MTYLVLDIETIKEPIIYEAWKNRELSKGNDITNKFPPPITHKIVALSCALIKSNYELKFITTSHIHMKIEENIIEEFSEIMQTNKSNIISWNGRRFDLPVIVYRSLKYGIPLEWYYNINSYRYRYTTEGHFDIADYITDYYASEVPNLDFVAKLIGLPGKMETTGADVEKMYENGQLTEIASYCTTDVLQTYVVFLKLLLTMGNINISEYNDIIKKFKQYLVQPIGKGPIVNKACKQLLNDWK